MVLPPAFFTSSFSKTSLDSLVECVCFWDLAPSQPHGWSLWQGLRQWAHSNPVAMWLVEGGSCDPNGANQNAFQGISMLDQEGRVPPRGSCGCFGTLERRAQPWASIQNVCRRGWRMMLCGIDVESLSLLFMSFHVGWEYEDLKPHKTPLRLEGRRGWDKT